MNNIVYEKNEWETITLNSVSEIIDTLAKLRIYRWLSRGHSKCQEKLVPKIDRISWGKNIDRAEKIKLERQSIELFRSLAREVASFDEKKALHEDISTLMVLQHYEVPTRLLDWSLSPYIAAYFSTNNKDSDGEIWSFEYKKYLEEASKQWTKTNKSENRYNIVFDKQVPNPDFFTCEFLRDYFHRVSAQEGLFSLTAKFGQDHANSISKLMGDSKYYKKYIIKAELKQDLSQTLRKDYGVWMGSLFPDTVGSAETIKKILFEHM